MPGRWGSHLLALAVSRPVVAALRLDAAQDGATRDPPRLRPPTAHGRFGFAHYNIVIPELASPHRFMACGVMIGQSGTQAFDDDHALVGGPRGTATVANGTAATAPHWFQAMSVARDCELSEDGSVLRFGRELVISGTFPRFSVTVDRDDFTVELQLEAEGAITWFARSAIYEHIGVPCRYAGRIGWHGEATEVSGLCSLEYARAAPPRLWNRPVPSPLKLPIELFTYQVLALDADTLLLLTDAHLFGRSLVTTAHIWTAGARRQSYGRGVRMTRSGQRSLLVAPDRAQTRIPAEFRWTIDIEQGRVLELEAAPDTAMIYGIGRGWIGGLRYHGTHDGREIGGRGYVEYVDRRR